MNRGRRPIPPVQILAALRRAKRDGLTFDEAWIRAVNGEVCDAYRSVRMPAEPDEPWPDGDGDPPALRASDSPSRCAGCRFVGEQDVCAAFGARVFTGVVWPPQTADRQQWKAATAETEDEWRAAYEGRWTPLGVRIAALSAGPLDGEAPSGADPARADVAREPTPRASTDRRGAGVPSSAASA